MEYIDKDALVAEIKRRKNICQGVAKANENNEFTHLYYKGKTEAYSEMSEFLDTIEVKDVDLDNEYIEEVYSHLDGIKDTADRMTSGNFMHNRAAIKFSANTIAKVLELIGLKAQKGE